MVYKQLTQEQRYMIYALRQEGCSQRRIAEVVRVHPATISRELRRNIRYRGYRPAMAHRMAMKRRLVPRKVSLLTPVLCARLAHYLRKQWSPEQIAGRLERLGSIQISHQTIYKLVSADRQRGGFLYQELRHGGRPRRRHPKADGSTILDRVSIELRPPVVAERSRLGDWEADTIVSPQRKSVLVSLVERKSRFSLLAKIPNKRASQLTQSVVRLMAPLKARVLTITSDNGTEFAAHKIISRKLQADFFFAHPYSSWERGLNENTNGLVRQYLPKQSSFEPVTPKQVSAIMIALNHRPRKSLDFRTPAEVFYEQPVALGP